MRMSALSIDRTMKRSIRTKDARMGARRITAAVSANMHFRQAIPRRAPIDLPSLLCYFQSTIGVDSWTKDFAEERKLDESKASMADIDCGSGKSYGTLARFD